MVRKKAHVKRNRYELLTTITQINSYTVHCIYNSICLGIPFITVRTNTNLCEVDILVGRKEIIFVPLCIFMQFQLFKKQCMRHTANMHYVLNTEASHIRSFNIVIDKHNSRESIFV